MKRKASAVLAGYQKAIALRWNETQSGLADWLAPFSARTCSGNLELNPGLSVLDAPAVWIRTPAVVDGLGAIWEMELNRAITEGKGSRSAACRSSVLDVELIGPEMSVREIPALSADVSVRKQKAILSTRSRSVPILSFCDPLHIRALRMLTESAGVRAVSAGYLFLEGGVREGTARMRMLPQIRRSLNLNTVNPQLIESFLRESEAVKGVPSASAQILAIFRNVPVALISRFRFLEESGVLIYTISSCGSASRARVHDLAAVRDPVNQVIHLVPHRTRYKTAFLS